MKYQLVLLVVLLQDAYSQEVSFTREFKWEEVEKQNSKLIEDFITLTPKEFEFYKVNQEYTPTIDDLKNDLHVIDLNNDKLDDIVFDGESGGEPREIEIYINKGNSFKKVFSDMQGISKMKFKDGVLVKLNIVDWGCCAEFIIRNRIYDVKLMQGDLKFELKNSFQYVDKTELPSEYWSKPKTVKNLNTNYNMRFTPVINDSSDFYFSGEPQIGNVIGKLKKNSIAMAIGQATDSTGRIWYFVAVYPDQEVMESYFYDVPEEQMSFKCGWISSRYLETIE